MTIINTQSIRYISDKNSFYLIFCKINRQEKCNSQGTDLKYPVEKWGIDFKKWNSYSIQKIYCITISKILTIEHAATE